MPEFGMFEPTAEEVATRRANSREAWLASCKKLAMEQLADGREIQALLTLANQMNRHPATSNHPVVVLANAMFHNQGLSTVAEMRAFINSIT